MRDKKQLLQDATAALEAGKNAEAADLLKELVEQDPENVPAWEALSLAVDDVDEKRMALTTILQLDPDNAYAKETLQQTEEKESAQKDREEVVPGITRQRARTVGLGLFLYTLVVCGVAFALTNLIRTSRSEQRAELTRVAYEPTRLIVEQQATETQIQAEASEEAYYETATAAMTITPTLEPSRTPVILPTDTPTATATQENTARLYPPPPIEVPGSIYAWGGRNNSSREFLDFRRYQVNDEGNYTVVSDDLVRNPQIVDGLQQLYYERFKPQGIQDAWYVYQVSQNTPTLAGRDFTEFYGQNVFEIRDLNVADDGSAFVMIGESFNNNRQAEVYLMDINTSTVSVMNTDRATYSEPAISPDGQLVIAVREDPATGTDLVLFDRSLEEAAYLPMTEDGNTLLESDPVFSPDGTKVAFTATGANGTDIYILQLSGTSSLGVVSLLSSPASETNPVFSPSGQYLAYSSDENGINNIFIYDIQGATVYQLTEEDLDPVYPGDWSQQ